MELLQSTELSNTVIAPGESVVLINLRLSHKKNSRISYLEILNKNPENYKLTYCYCSVYGKCWQVKGWDNINSDSVCNPNISF